MSSSLGRRPRRSIALAAAPAAVLLILAGCTGGADGSDESATSAPSTSATTETPTPTPTPTPAPTPTPTSIPTVIDYTLGADGGFVIMHDSDIDKMTGAPADFKAYLHAELAKLSASDGSDSQCRSTISVTKLAPRGWAAGAISDCGGANIYWAKVNGAWKQAFGSQEEAPRCKDLKKYAFPVSIGGKFCLDNDANKVPYTP